MLCIPTSGILLKNPQWPALQLACMISLGASITSAASGQLLAGSLFSLKFVSEVHHVFVQVLSKYANLSLKILCCRIHDTDFPTIFLNRAVVKILYKFSFISAVD